MFCGFFEELEEALGVSLQRLGERFGIHYLMLVRASEVDGVDFLRRCLTHRVRIEP
jgi:hypothetical protein